MSDETKLHDLTQKLAGYHFSQECLKPGEREILRLAEAFERMLRDEHTARAAAEQRAEEAERSCEEWQKRACGGHAWCGTVCEAHQPRDLIIEPCPACVAVQTANERDAAQAAVAALREVIVDIDLAKGEWDAEPLSDPVAALDKIGEHIERGLTMDATLATQHDAAVRRKALEEAAQVARAYGAGRIYTAADAGVVMAIKDAIAAAIRALMAQNPEGDLSPM